MIKMKALISSIESVMTGYRVAQVERDDAVFAVAEGLFWVDCLDEVVADRYWFDPVDQTIKKIVAQDAQPAVNGAQTL